MAPAKTFTQEVESPVAPARLFKALVLDSHTLLPDLIPNSFDSVEIEEGDSIDIGSIKKFHFAEVDELDEDNFYSMYTTTEGDTLDGKYEYIVNETKFEAAGTGSIWTLTSHFYLKDGVEINEERIKSGHEKMKKMFMIVEEYLVANPEAYA